jgi:hypothetical protein
MYKNMTNKHDCYNIKYVYIMYMCGVGQKK